MTWEGLHIKWKFYLFFFLAPQISRVQKKLIKLYKNLNAHTHTHIMLINTSIFTLSFREQGPSSQTQHLQKEYLWFLITQDQIQTSDQLTKLYIYKVS